MKSKLFQKLNPRARCLGVLIIAINIVACIDNSSDKEAEKISNSFIEYYYVEDNLQQAITLTTQAAKKTLQKQLDVIESVNEEEPASGRPKIKFKHLSSKDLSDKKISMIWEINSDSANTIYVKTTQVYSDNTKTWEITDFIESSKVF